MAQRLLSERSRLVQLFTFLFLLFSSLIIGVTFAMFCLPMVSEVHDVTKYIGQLDQQIEHIDATIFLQIVVSTCLFLIPAFLFGLMMTGRVGGYFAREGDRLWLKIAMACAIILAMNYALYPTVEWMKLIPLPAETHAELDAAQSSQMRLLEAFFNVEGATGMLSVFLMIAILPALGEELFFRGVLQRWLYDGHGRAVSAIIVSSILFGMIHFQFYNAIAISAMGILLGYLYYWTKNIWVPIAAHLFNNGTQVLMQFAAKQRGEAPSMEQVDVAWYISVLAALVAIALLYYYQQHLALRR